MMTFDDLNLNKPLRNALEELGFEHPTPIQEQAFSVVMSGRDLVGIAQTGTGKTYAYLLPILRQWKFSKQLNPKVLIVVPTRELVIQIVGEIKKLTPYMAVRAEGVYGGTNMNTQKSVVLQGLDILVATPGRLLDLSYCGALKLKSVKQLVIDEVDEMLNLGFRTQLNNLLDLLPPKRQHLLFSATLSEEVEQLINTFFYQPEKIEIVPVGTPLDQIDQQGYKVPNYNTKVNLLERLLADEEKTKVLVFAPTKKIADRLYNHLMPIYEEEISIIHSNKSQNFRMNAVKQFHEGTVRILIATDVIARGVDISKVTHVVNFDTPEIAENYIHRIGRTGRADKRGIAITFTTEKEQKHLEALEELMSTKVPQLPLPEDLVISTVLTEEEKPSYGQKDYLQPRRPHRPAGAFHEKSAKNKKQNFGGMSKRKYRDMKRKKKKK